eukprot:TRINITY_DN307_c0_g2_i1.p1 TRINITY_DN307_c0_g2~~TRINITY_DN307_c0_g2_i1.p1  ORF type:complete len:78 (-),score=12.54 TRINITY_DN307_c0_g2_i1:90-323(-)
MRIISTITSALLQNNASLGSYACGGNAMTVVHDNTIFTADGYATECGHAAPYTKGTTVAKIPNAEQIITWAKEKLGL